LPSSSSRQIGVNPPVSSTEREREREKEKGREERFWWFLGRRWNLKQGKSSTSLDDFGITVWFCTLGSWNTVLYFVGYLDYENIWNYHVQMGWFINRLFLWFFWLVLTCLKFIWVLFFFLFLISIWVLFLFCIDKIRVLVLIEEWKLLSDLTKTHEFRQRTWEIGQRTFWTW
jgi:hypothetical protein